MFEVSVTGREVTYTLQDVQQEVARQIGRDYSARNPIGLQCLMCLGLPEEAGEVAGLMKRLLRCHDDKDVERSSHEHFIEELGDVLWYLAATCQMFGITLDQIWLYNYEKLQKRYGE